MRASSLVTFSVLAVVAPIAAAPHPLELYEIKGTSTHIFHIATGVPQTTAVPSSILTDLSYATAVIKVDSSGNVGIYKNDPTSTRTFHFGTGGSHVAHPTGFYKSVGTGSWHHHHATGQYGFVAGTGVVPARTTSLTEVEQGCKRRIPSQRMERLVAGGW